MLIGESVNYAGADAKAGKGTRARHKSDFSNICERFIIFCELIADEL